MKQVSKAKQWGIIFVFYLAVNFFLIWKISFFLISKIQEKELKLHKFELYYNLLGDWVTIKQEKKEVAGWLRTNQYTKIAIYGMGKLGQCLYKELDGSGIDVIYIVDRKKQNIEVQQFGMDDDLPEVDAIIVTPICEFNSISECLRKKLNCPIISLEKIIWSFRI